MGNTGYVFEHLPSLGGYTSQPRHSPLLPSLSKSGHCTTNLDVKDTTVK